MSEPTRRDSGQQTRLDEQTGITRIDGAPLQSQRVAVLPAELAANYQVIKAFETVGAEADLYLVKRSDGINFVLKVYRRGLKPKVDVIEALQGCDRAHVVETVAYGESEGLWYELLEYGQHGTLRDRFKSGRIGETDMLAVLRELSAAIAHIHEKRIIHRDLKPENVLVRARKPLDLVLTDFGIASRSDATQHFTTRNRTIKYGAPEAAAGSVGNSSDYWSLGLIVLEGLTGRHPFDGLSDIAIAVQLATSKVDVSSLANVRWRNLCFGLLIRDPKKRWGAAQVSKWLNGENPPLHADEVERPSQKPYKLAKHECWTATDLAIQLARNWKEGERHLARGLILPWLRDELRDQDAANLLIDLAEDKKLKTDDRLVRLIAGLGKGLPPVWLGKSLDSETLAAACSEAIAGKNVEADFITDLYERGILDVWGQAGNEEAAEWQRLWVQAVEEFRSKWESIRKSGGPQKQIPDSRLLQSASLLAIVSNAYRLGVAAELATSASVLSRCHWFLPLINDKSIAAVLLSHTLKDEALAAGQLEIDSAVDLVERLNELQREFAAVIDVNPAFQQEIRALRASIAKNKATESITQSFPVVRATIFEASRQTLVQASLRKMRGWYWRELLADAATVALIFVLARYWLGENLTGDSWGLVGAHLTSGESAGSTRSYLFLLLLAVAGMWVAFRGLTRWWGRSLFGK